MLTIAVFLVGGVAANSLWSAEHGPSTTPVTDAVVAPENQDTTVPAPAPTAHRPPHTERRASRRNTRSPMPSHSKTATRPTRSSVKSVPEEAAAVRLTNAQRARHGCTPLRVEPELRTAARRHSADMRDRRYFAHDSPDGKSPWDRVKAAGYPIPGAENIARGHPSATAVVTGWMNSSGHRANILNCKLKAVGIGIAYGPGGPWWTQDFGLQ